MPKFTSTAPLFAALLGTLLLAAGCSRKDDASAPGAGTFVQSTADEAQIRKLAADILAMYAAQPDPRSIDMAREIYVDDNVMPPIITDMGETEGQPWSNKGKAGWINVMSAYNKTPRDKLPKKFEFELKDSKVVVDGNVGSMATLLPTRITLQNDKVISLNSRYTWIFLRVDGKWKLWHEHWSVPADFASLMATAR